MDAPYVGDASAAQPRTWIRSVDTYGLAAFVVLAYLAEQIGLLRRLLTSDGWLALLAGRTIVHHGLPHTDTWNVISNGRRWVDQQWLAQLTFYGLERTGGIRLLLVAGLLLAVGSYIAAAILGVRRGGNPRVLVWVVVIALVPFGRSADNLRAQSLCYPLFLALVWLLIRQERRPTWAGYLALPILVLWANLHGSVVFAALIVSACALVSWRREVRLRTLVLTVGPWLCVLASPYARDLPHYYRLLLVNPAFGSYVEEWKAPTAKSPDVVTFALAFAVAYVLGSRREGWSRIERMIIVVCTFSALLAARNGVWLALAAVVLLPAALSQLVPRTPTTAFARRTNRSLVAVGTVAVVAAIAATASKPGNWFTRGYPSNAADRAAAIAGGGGRVFATEDYADWLLWLRPELTGRVAFDARLELLKAAELQRIFEFENEQNTRILMGYDVAVVPSTLAPYVARMDRRLTRRYDRDGVAVLAAAESP